MTRPVREIVAELASSGLTPDQHALVTELAVAAAADASGGRSKHAEAQARYRERNRVITRDHSDHSDHKNHGAYIEAKNKKDRKKTISVDVPERPTEKAINFATAHWDLPKIQTEWGRFRDHSLAKGKRHRDVDAAWRNWVTSPYQQQTRTTNGHATRTVGSAFDDLIARAEGDRGADDRERDDDLRVVGPQGG